MSHESPRTAEDVLRALAELPVEQAERFAIEYALLAPMREDGEPYARDKWPDLLKGIWWADADGASTTPPGNEHMVPDWAVVAGVAGRLAIQRSLLILQFLLLRFPDTLVSILLRGQGALGKEQLEEALAKLDRFKGKQRYQSRDDEIVRLRDNSDPRLSFGEIGLRLTNLNQAWVGRDDRPLSSKAVARAYHRRKKALRRG
jgi:hypothetical protein